MMTSKEAAAVLGCSISTAKRYVCKLCEISMLDVAKGRCHAMFGEPCTEEIQATKIASFKGRNQKTSDKGSREDGEV